MAVMLILSSNLSSWINLSLFQPSYIFTSIHAFKRKHINVNGRKRKSFETPGINMDEKMLKICSPPTTSTTTAPTPRSSLRIVQQCAQCSPPPTSYHPFTFLFPPSPLPSHHPLPLPPGSTLHLSFFPSPLFPRRTFLALKWRCHSVSHRSRQILTHSAPNTHLVMMITMQNC